MPENNPFETLDKLGHNVKVYVPSTVDVDNPVDNSPMVETVSTELSLKFGGCTQYAAFGAWVDEYGKLVRESVTVCQSFTSDIGIDALLTVYRLAHKVKREMSQQCVSVEVDGTLYFV